jgi:hypothetical protein
LSEVRAVNKREALKVALLRMCRLRGSSVLYLCGWTIWFSTTLAAAVLVVLTKNLLFLLLVFLGGFVWHWFMEAGDVLREAERHE